MSRERRYKRAMRNIQRRTAKWEDRSQYLVKPSEEGVRQLKFICAALQCQPEEFFADLIPIHYRHLNKAITKELEAHNHELAERDQRDEGSEETPQGAGADPVAVQADG